MADVLKQNEILQKEVTRLKREAALKEQNDALKREILKLKKAAAVQRKPLIRALVVSSYPVKKRAVHTLTRTVPSLNRK